MSAIQPGDVVVAVHSRFSSCRNPLHAPGEKWTSSGIVEAGRLYTVEGIAFGDFGRCGSRAIRLVEVTSPTSPVGFCPGCFRKIDAADEQFTRQMHSILKERVGI